MISVEEMAYLHWLTASEEWSGEGDVLEIGPWLGGSTWCLASGMEANAHRSPSARLRVVDTFRWRPFMSRRADLPLAVDESFRPAFEANLLKKRALLDVIEARLPDDSSADLIHAEPVRTSVAGIPVLDGDQLPRPLEIAFVDGAKSWRGMTYLMTLIAQRLTPQATLVFQDFKNWATYWVPMWVGMLSQGSPQGLSVVHVLGNDSVTFRKTPPALGTELASMPTEIETVPLDTGIRAIDAAADLLSDAGDRVGASVVRVSGVTYLGSRGAWSEAIERFRSVESQWPAAAQGFGHLLRSREWLQAHTGKPVPWSGRGRALKTYARTAGTLQRPLRIPQALARRVSERARSSQ